MYKVVCGVAGHDFRGTQFHHSGNILTWSLVTPSAGDQLIAISPNITSSNRTRPLGRPRVKTLAPVMSTMSRKKSGTDAPRARSGEVVGFQRRHPPLHAR
ncbi:hypothetical protein BR93DRAFT_260475 [Coniochaeta sp. PMI_546]|nr:hypothetical protein BR93DRAFT_260475 [Coniochaeta sp. PMI_546]